MNTTDSWLNRIPEHLGVRGSRRVSALEAIRVRHDTPHDLFARIVCHCPAARRRHYSFLDRCLLLEMNIGDIRQRRGLVVASSIQVIDRKIKNDEATCASIEKCIQLAKSILEAKKTYDDWNEVVSDCMEIDRASGEMIEQGEVVREVDEQVLGIAADLLVAVPFSGAAEMLDRFLAEKKTKDEES